MSVIESVEVEFKSAMKSVIASEGVAKEDAKFRLNTIRSIKAAITAEETSGKSRSVLSDADVESVLRRQIKSLESSVEIYTEAGESAKAEVFRPESEIVREFVTEQLGEDETRAIVLQIIAEKGLAGSGGRGIGQVMKELKGNSSIDAGLASKIAKESL